MKKLNLEFGESDACSHLVFQQIDAPISSF